MVSIAARITALCQASGHSIVGVSIGRRDDKTTWRVQPEELQAACQPIIDGFDPNDPAHAAAESDAEVESIKCLRALARATYELKSNNWTQAEYFDRIKAIYRNL